MAKTKNKSHSELENVRGIIREYEKEIRSLRQQLRQYEKYEARSQDDEIGTDSEDTHVEMKMTKDCDSCGKGKLVETLNLGHRGIFGHCAHCGFHGKIK